MEAMVQTFNGEELLLPPWIQLVRTSWGPALAAEGEICGFPQKGDLIVFTRHDQPPAIIRVHRPVGDT